MIAERLLRRLAANTDSSVARGDWYRTRWIAAATANGWVVHWEDGHFLELRQGQQRLRVARSDAGLDTNVTFRIVADKARTTRLLEAVGVPTPRSQLFDIAESRKLFRAIMERGDQVVVKPAVGTGGGAGVTVGPAGRRAVADAIKEAAVFGRSIAVDERIEGRVFRVLVLDGVVLDAVHRTPAHITGDGRSTLAALVDAENDRRRALGAGSTGFIRTGSDHRAALRKADTSRGSTPAADESIAVAGITNSGSELESTRITLTAATSAMSVAAASALGVRFAGVDIVIDDQGRPIAVLEVNTAPGLHWHELVVGDPFDAFAAVLSAIGEH